MDVAALETIPLFASLDDEARQSFATACTELEVPAGETLTREGDFGYVMFAIRSGVATVCVDGSDVRTLGPGDVFGEIAVLSGGRRTATVVATTPMHLLAVMNRDVWRLERDAPEVADRLRAAIAGFLQGADR